MTNLNKEDLLALQDAENLKKTRKLNEFGISKMANVAITKSEKTGVKPNITSLAELKKNKTTSKLINICSE